MDLILFFLLLILIGIGVYLYLTLKAEPPSTGGHNSLVGELKSQIKALQTKLEKSQAATTQAETLAEERKIHIAKLEADLLQLRKRLNDYAEEKLELSNELTREKVKNEEEQTAKEMVAELRRKIDEKFDRR